MAALLEIERVSQTFVSRGRSFLALGEVTFTLHEDEFMAIVGPAGCGKSTLLRIVTGLQRATEGKVLYRQEVLEGINRDATIVFQNVALFPWLTVQENVEIALKVHSLPANLRRTRALKFLDMVGLDGFETAYPRELSGGMRQKVGFARAMAVEPELLCLDEPFSSLDVLSARALRGELLEIWGSGKIPTKAILLVTHNIEEAVFMANRIVVMDKQPGRVMAELRVELPHPRNVQSPEFHAMVDRVYATLAGQTQAEPIELGTAPGEPGGRARPLPEMTINGLIGFLENLGDLPGHKADIYQLAQDLHLVAEKWIALTEAAEMLGFATIAHGDISLTPLGETFAEASITARKEIFATRIRRMPLFKWLLSMLHKAEENRMNRSLLQTALELEFPAEEAERQLETVVNWGRYAELLAYDDDQEVIYLEPAPG